MPCPRPASGHLVTLCGLLLAAMAASGGPPSATGLAAPGPSLSAALDAPVRHARAAFASATTVRVAAPVRPVPGRPHVPVVDPPGRSAVLAIPIPISPALAAPSTQAARARALAIGFLDRRSFLAAATLGFLPSRATAPPPASV